MKIKIENQQEKHTIQDYWNKIIQVLAKLSKGTCFKGHKHYELTNNANTAIGLAARATILKIRTQN